MMALNAKLKIMMALNAKTEKTMMALKAKLKSDEGSECQTEDSDDSERQN